MAQLLLIIYCTNNQEERVMKTRHLIIVLFTFIMSFTSIAHAKIHDLISSTVGSSNILPGRIIIDAPDIAENGAVVPVSINQVKLEKKGVHVKKIWLFSDSYEKAIAHFKLSSSSIVEGLATRIKMAKSGMVYAVAQLSDGRFISGKKSVKITIGGCGGGGTTASYPRPSITNYRPPSFTTSTEKYTSFKNNGVIVCQQQPLSTFSIDVDTGSYSNVRRFIMNEGRLPQTDAVRVEEMINYFNYAYAAPEDKQTPFSVHTEVGPNPWNNKTHLLQIGLKGYEKNNAALPPANLVFLLDVSGSMASANKLPLLVNSLKLLTKQLRKKDRISIVVYAGASGVVLATTPGNQRERIISALERLAAGGSTNGGAGIQLAYNMAKSSFIKDGINRVILATDGDFNVGMTGHNQLVNLIKDYRKKGISLTTLGFGTGNYNEKLMEQLADHGNGNYAYIDNFMEAKKVLVEQMAGTLFTIARDVKIQVEFNPSQVAEYRLVGYENRVLANEDFSNDQVDAGDIGAGHTVTAIYEITLAESEFRYIPPLRYAAARSEKSTNNAIPNEIATIKLRYKVGESNTSNKVEHAILRADLKHNMNETSADYRFAASVATFGQWLRKNEKTPKINLTKLQQLAAHSLKQDKRGYRHEFIRLLETAAELKN